MKWVTFVEVIDRLLACFMCIFLSISCLIAEHLPALCWTVRLLECFHSAVLCHDFHNFFSAVYHMEY